MTDTGMISRRRASQETVLAAFRKVGTVTAACAAAGVGRRTHYDWLRDDKWYADAFSDAREDFADALEAEAARRAIEGTNRPVFYKGEKVGDIREFSDLLLITLLNANRPQKFRQRHEHTGKDDGPILHRHEAQMDLDLTKLTDDELRVFEQMLQKLQPAAVHDPDRCRLPGCGCRPGFGEADGHGPARLVPSGRE